MIVGGVTKGDVEVVEGVLPRGFGDGELERLSELVSEGDVMDSDGVSTLSIIAVRSMLTYTLLFHLHRCSCRVM